MTILDRITEARRHGSRAIPVEIDEIERLREALAVCRTYFDAYVAEKAADRTYCDGPVHYDMARKFEAAVYPERVR